MPGLGQPENDPGNPWNLINPGNCMDHYERLAILS